MWSALLSFFGWLFDKLFAKPAGPPLEVTEAAGAATATQVAKTDSATLQSETRVAQAEADAPTSQEAVVAELNKGAF